MQGAVAADPRGPGVARDRRADRRGPALGEGGEVGLRPEAP
jgi:hypothetical protein